MPTKFEAPAQDDQFAAREETFRQPYSRPTVESLDVGSTRGKGVPSPESTVPVTGS